MIEHITYIFETSLKCLNIKSILITLADPWNT